MNTTRARLQPAPGRLNPYKLGIELLRDIETTLEHRAGTAPQYDDCDDMAGSKRKWGKDKMPTQGRESSVEAHRDSEKIFQVREIYNDVTFLDEFLTPEFVEDQKLYQYRYDPATGRMVVVDRDFRKVKQQLLFMLTNHAQPYIYVLDGNYHNRGELYLGHRHTGADLDIKFAVETLKAIHRVWKRPVHVQGRIDGEPILFSFDGEKSSQQKVDDNVAAPHTPSDRPSRRGIAAIRAPAGQTACNHRLQCQFVLGPDSCTLRP